MNSPEERKQLSDLNIFIARKNKLLNLHMLGNRDEINGSIDARLQVESLRYLYENEPEEFQKAKRRLEGTDLWEAYEREYGDC